MGTHNIQPETESPKTQYIEGSERRYREKRIANWDRTSPHLENPRRLGGYYQKLLQHYYGLLIPQGLRIVELGCGHGDLLASLNPSLGVGIDFSGEMIRRASKRHPNLLFVQADAHEITFKEKFDVIILSDLVNDLWDVQGVLERLPSLCHSRTRLVLNFYNNLWRIPLSMVKLLGLGFSVLEQNWLSPYDILNLLKLSGFEAIKRGCHILLPLKIPLLSDMANRFFAHLVPLNWFSLTNFVVARPTPECRQATLDDLPSVSIILPARNEAGNIEDIFRRVPTLGKDTELIFIEGHSKDNTYEKIEQTMKQFPERRCRVFRQAGKGKGDAVRLGFEKAGGDILMILDTDMTVMPEDLPRFFDALVSRKGDFVNGVRLVYPLEDQSMRFFNIFGNKFFSLAFSWILEQPIKDTLCGTKVLWKSDYELIAKGRDYFGNFDPFGDFDLLFGAAKLNLKIVEMPIRYQPRTYGKTNIDRWRHGWLLFRMVSFAARRIKFV